MHESFVGASHLVEAHEDGALDVLALPHRLDHEVRRRQTLQASCSRMRPS